MAFLTQEQLDALAQFDTPTICNAIEGFGVRGRTEGFTRPELRTVSYTHLTLPTT